MEIFSNFIIPRYRAELAFKLKTRGYYVRMHAYEYLLGDFKKLTAILLLEPYKNKAFIKMLIDNHEMKIELINLIKSIEPRTEIIII